MTGRSVVLASSPVIGPLTMQRLGASLREIGIDVASPAAPFDLDEFVDVVAAAAGRVPSLLVGFSAAGPRIYAVAARCHAAGVVFLDARPPDDGRAPVEEPAFAELLGRLPVDEHGMLPPWPGWWPGDVLVALCPDAAVHAHFVGECPPVWREMYDRPIPAPTFGGPCGYLAFGDGYADQRDLAVVRGWPTATLEQGHLAPLVAPREVAAAIDELAERMGVW